MNRSLRGALNQRFARCGIDVLCFFRGGFQAAAFDGALRDASDGVEMFLRDLGAEALLYAAAEGLGLAGEHAGGARIDSAARCVDGLPADLGGFLLYLLDVGNIARGDEGEGGERDQNSHAR